MIFVVVKLCYDDADHDDDDDEHAVCVDFDEKDDGLAVCLEHRVIILITLSFGIIRNPCLVFIPDCLLVGWLLDVPATCLCISGTDLLRQFYVLPH